MKSILVFAGAVALLAGTAQAASITNRDTTEHSIVITAGGGEGAPQEIVIAAEESVTGVCMEGCMMGVDGGDAMEVGSDEQLVIQDGVLTVE